MQIETKKYARKPFHVEAVQVTTDNFNDLLAWCEGKEEWFERPGDQGNGKKYIKVNVMQPMNPRQTRAFIGDWILFTEKGGFKVFTNKAFIESFDPVTPQTVVDNITLHSIGPVTANPSPENGIGEIKEVETEKELVDKTQSAKA